MAKYNCVRGASAQKTKMTGLVPPTGMLYLSKEGRKVVTPNDRRVEAEIKNRSEAMRLEFHKRQLDKEILRGKFLIKMEQKEAVHALKVMMNTSGKSSMSVPPDGPNDKEHVTSPYFKGPTKLGRKKLIKWRMEEKEVQRMMHEKEINKPSGDTEKESVYNKEFLNMIKSLGLTKTDDGKDNDIIIPQVLPANTGRMLAIEEEEKVLDREKCFHPKAKPNVDVFECLKDPNKVSDGVKVFPRGTRRLKRALSAPVGGFSVRQWEKEIIDNYARAVSRPGSAKIETVPVRDVMKVIDDTVLNETQHKKRNFRIRPSSAPVRRKLDRETSKPERGQKCEIQSKVDITENQRRRRQSLGTETSHRRCGLIAVEMEHISPSNIQSKHQVKKQNMRVKNVRCSPATEVWVEKVYSDKNIKSDVVEQQEGQGEGRNKKSTQLRKKSTVSFHNRTLTNKTKVSTRKSRESEERSDQNVHESSPQMNEPCMKRCVSSSDETLKKESLDEESPLPESSQNDQEPSEGEPGSENEEERTHWQRDLSAEAPPGIFSTRMPVKIQLALSKLERQRELERLVKDNSFAISSMAEREKMRRVRQRLKTVATIEKVQNAAEVAKQKLGRPRTDQDILRDIETL